MIMVNIGNISKLQKIQYYSIQKFNTGFMNHDKNDNEPLKLLVPCVMIIAAAKYVGFL